MKYEIKQCSTIALTKIEMAGPSPMPVDRTINSIYPHSELEVGQSFNVQVNRVKEVNLRAFACSVGKLTGKRFVVIKHKQESVFEFARIG